MRISRVWIVAMSVIAGAAFLGGCRSPSATEQRLATHMKISIAIVAPGDALTEEELQARRVEVLAYLRSRSLIRPQDELIDSLDEADRIIRVTLGAGGGFKITVFDSPALTASLGRGNGMTYGATSVSYYTGPDPFYNAGYYYRNGTERGYYPYNPNEVPRSPNPNAPQPNPRHPPRSDDSPPREPPDHRPHHPGHGSEPRHDTPPTPRDDTPPRQHTPPPRDYSPPPPPPPSQPTHTGHQPPTAKDRDDKREDGKPLPER